MEGTKITLSKRDCNAYVGEDNDVERSDSGDRQASHFHCESVPQTVNKEENIEGGDDNEMRGSGNGDGFFFMSSSFKRRTTINNIDGRDNDVQRFGSQATNRCSNLRCEMVSQTTTRKETEEG